MRHGGVWTVRATGTRPLRLNRPGRGGDCCALASTEATELVSGNWLIRVMMQFVLRQGAHSEARMRTLTVVKDLQIPEESIR